MRHLVHIFFNPADDKKEEEAKKLLSNLEIVDYNYSGSLFGNFTVTIEKDDPRISRLLHELKKRKLNATGEPSIREEKIYTKKELESAELLQLIPVYTVEFSYKDKMEFDTSKACPVCKRPAIQKSELYIDTSKMGKKDIATTYDAEWVISERLANILEENRLTGYELRPVRHYTDRLKVVPKLYQILATNILSPLDPQTNIYQRKEFYCETCKRGIDVDFEFYYQRTNLKAMDFNKTYEVFSGGTQILVISKKAYQVLKQNKIRGIKVEPVVILSGSSP